MKTTLGEARSLWAEYVRLCEEHDEAVLDFYTDDSLIYEDVPGYKNMVKRGDVYVPFIRSMMRVANSAGQRIIDSTFLNVQMIEIDDNVAINCTRHSNLKNFDSPFSLLVGKTADERVVILEERMEHLLDGTLEEVEVTIELEQDEDGQQIHAR